MSLYRNIGINTEKKEEAVETVTTEKENSKTEEASETIKTQE